jgi:hypothetical protein
MLHSEAYASAAPPCGAIEVYAIDVNAVMRCDKNSYLPNPK